MVRRPLIVEGPKNGTALTCHSTGRPKEKENLKSTDVAL